MKIKTLNKKLALHKETVTNLNPGDMSGVKGGTSGRTCVTDIDECPSYASSCCPFNESIAGC